MVGKSSLGKSTYQVNDRGCVDNSLPKNHGSEDVRERGPKIAHASVLCSAKYLKQSFDKGWTSA